MFIKTGNITSKSRSSPVSIDLPVSKTVRRSDGAILATFGGGPFQTQTDTESISYTGRPRNQRSLANFCVHKHSKLNILYTGTIMIPSHTAASPTNDIHYNGYPVHSATAHGLAVSAANTAFGVPLGTSLLGANGLTYINDGFSRMRPDLTELSVPNFILEIGQIKSLFKLWSARRPVLQNVANAHLNLNFGWLPTIGDIGAMVGSIKGLHQKIKDWNNSLGKLVSKRCLILSDTINKSGSLASTPFSTGTTVWNASLTRRVTAHVMYRPCPIKAMTDTERLLRGLLDSLGFELNPSILWNAIPFSFVVDWFINIGGYLEGLKLDTLELPIKLETSYLQYEQLASYGSYVKDAGDAIQQSATYPGATSSEKLFHRMLITPRTEDFLALGWRLPNLKQWTLGLALGLTRSK